MKTVALILTFLLSATAYSQDMAAGFTLLETGKYQEAKIFFENVLTTHPTNKTARLCYGRALGLSGDSGAARTLFIELKKEYPTDFEVGLNYAEALLWDNDFTAAKTFYKTLIAQDSTSFSALLGYANTLSSLKEYDAAIQYVHKALVVQPKNANAAVSKKYMHLGKAAQLSTAYQYEEAITLLSTTLSQMPKDAQLTSALANVYIAQKDFDNANKMYRQHTDSLSGRVGMSLVAHLQKKDKQALTLAEEGLAFAKADSTENITANERYIQALIWNGYYSQARTSITVLVAKYPTNKRVAALKATLGMYTGTFSKSIEVYRAILEKDSTSFDGNLGIANAYRALGNLDQAHAFAKKTLTFYPNQKDATTLIQTIESSLAPVIQTVAAYTKDNGDNEAYSAGITATLPFSDRFKTVFAYGYRTTENMTTETMAYNTNASIGAHYRVVNNTWVEGTLGFVKAQADVNEYTDVNGSVFIKSRPLPLQYLEAGYSRTLQDFNAALLDEKIFMNNYSLNYNMGTNINLGWYTGLMHTKQTDGNTRNLLFTSLYYTFTKSPALKGGINYQYVGFKNQVPSLYFSPSKYQAAEVFLDLTGTAGKWNYAANAAGGYQFVEGDKKTTLFRLEGRVQYTLSNRLQVGAYGKYSNIASATAAGFEFMEVGVKLRWQILSGSGDLMK
ncbi:MAG: tetratricopeptide (TPR) repeat protein [Flavobacteriales bacterium]|jgi:tetratricopeptide (TPR) repeat protein